MLCRVSSPAATHRVDDRRSADRATGAVMQGVGLRAGGFREALRTAILETAYNVADWAGSGEIAVTDPRSKTESSPAAGWYDPGANRCAKPKRNEITKSNE